MPKVKEKLIWADNLEKSFTGLKNDTVIKMSVRSLKYIVSRDISQKT